MDNKRIKTALVVVFSVFAVTTLLAMAQPTATNLYVEDASGYKDTTISLPVNILDTQSGVAGIEFELVYNKSVLNLTQIREGNLFNSSSLNKRSIDVAMIPVIASNIFISLSGIVDNA